MTEALATVPGEYTPHQKEIMMETVAKGCKPEQFMLMMELAKKYQLDPFARQIWATPAGIIIGRDGFLAIAHKSGNFDGMDTEFIERNGKLYAAKTTVWHKKMTHPITFTALLAEYAKPSPGKPGAWDKMPYVMLQKCAESNALRRAFSVSGLYDEAEICENPQEPEDDPPVVEYIDADFTEHPTAADPPRPTTCTKCGCALMTPEEQQTMTESFRKLGFTDGVGDFVSTLCKQCAADAWRQARESMQGKPPAVPTKNPGTPAKPEPSGGQQVL